MRRSPGRYRVTRTLAAALAGALVLALGLGLGSCAKRITEVDPNFVFLEGRATPDAQLVIWYQDTVEVRLYFDITDPPGPARDPFCNDHILGPGNDPEDVGRREHLTFGEAGRIQVAIMDHTPANAFRPMRREANGGYRAPLDFPLIPSRKWLEGQWELYSYRDDRPSGFLPPTYIARGIISGQESNDSPLTNEGVLRQAKVENINYTGRCLPCDSLFTLRWDPVAGAARYWLHVFQFANGVSESQMLQASRPGPVNEIRPRDILVAVAPGSATSYKLRDATRTDVVRMVERVTRYGQTYLVRVAAVDSAGQLLAYTRGDYGLLERGDRYGLYLRGGVAIRPKRRTIPEPPFCQPD